MEGYFQWLFPNKFCAKFLQVTTGFDASYQNTHLALCTWGAIFSQLRS